MLEEKKKKIKEMFLLNSDENNKKKIENLVVFVIILVITIIFINVIWNDNKKDTKQNSQIVSDKVLAKVEDEKEMIVESNELEKRLEDILKNIVGVGDVKVLLTYSESSTTMAMYNEDSSKSDTQETDTNGGNRKVTQNTSKKEVIYQEINGEKIPVTQSIVQPKIEGAIITAIGASNSNVKTNIVQAVEAATGLATHKIQVFEMVN